MTRQSIISSLLQLLTAIVVMPLILTGQDENESMGWGSIGYSPGIIYFLPGVFDGMPPVYRGQTFNDRSVYPKMMAINGITGVVGFINNWRLGAMIDVGQAGFSASSNDSSFFGKTTLSCAGAIIEYAVPVDEVTRFYAALTGGLNVLRTRYQVISATPSWDGIFQGQSVVLTQNSIVSDPQFFIRAGVGTEFSILETIILKLESGIQISRFAGSRWLLDQSVPLANGSDVSVNAPYIKMMIGLGQ